MGCRSFNELLMLPVTLSSIRALSAGAALAVCITAPAVAQNDTGGRVEGVVFDSVHARPLASARVVIVGTGMQSEVRREAATDSIGRFHLDSLAPGRYVVGFESALLDSLEVALSPREVNLTTGHVATLDLAFPPLRSSARRFASERRSRRRRA